MFYDLTALDADITARKVVKFTFERSRSFQQVSVDVREIRVNRGTWEENYDGETRKNYRICRREKKRRGEERETDGVRLEYIGLFGFRR
jgi:hypothetical protein